MSDIVSIKVDDKGVLDLLKQLQGRMTDMSPVMRKIAGIMHDSVEENFRQQGRPRWQALSRATLEKGIKTYKRHSAFGKAGTITLKGQDSLIMRKILQQSGQLATGISQSHNSHQAIVSSNRGKDGIISLTHQFGTNKAGRKHNVSIPPRPFMKLQDSDIEEIKEAIMGYLMRG